jgi:alkanesulfonate monooxygenase SsuD/methylene tetrahydromethanopterin reductase-like flavin-dependent oxidoreductase (luciferase family)
MIGGGGERKTLRLVAQYADACNFFGPPEVVAHKVDVLRAHCEAVGRDIRHIDVTAFAEVGDDGSADDVLRSAEAFAALGVATVMARAVGADPAAALESVYGPAMERLTALQPKPL